MDLPDLTTIEIFLKKCKESSLQDITHELIKKSEYKTMVSFLKASMTHLLHDNNESTCDGYVSGFITCLELFRIHQEGKDMDLEELNCSISQLNSYVLALEEENTALRRMVEEYEHSGVNKPNNTVQ